MKRCGVGSLCERPGLSVWIGGVAAGEERDGLIFDVANPCGLEVNAARSDVAPLRRVTLWRGCLQYTGAPGERVTVSGHVLSRSRDGIGPGRITWSPLDPCGPGVVSSAPRIKLAVSSCGVPGEVIIDSDSQISVPAGEVTIDALIPAGSTAAGAGRDDGWQVLGTVELDSPQTFEEVQLIVRACPPSNEWTPGGVLTEWMPLDFEVPDGRVLVRPRRARSLAVQASDVGVPFAPRAVTVEWRQTLTRGIGATTFAAASQQIVDPWGAAPFLRVLPSASGRAVLRWGIV